MPHVTTVRNDWAALLSSRLVYMQQLPVLALVVPLAVEWSVWVPLGVKVCIGWVGCSWVDRRLLGQDTRAVDVAAHSHLCAAGLVLVLYNEMC